MQKTAKYIETLPNFNGEARLYETSDQGYVVVSAINSPWAIETYIFPSDSVGNITSYAELDGSYRGGTEHELALEYAGYEVTS